jgi:hypothetical protein
MSPRLAPSLVVLRTEYDEAHPGRPRHADGWIGDPAHAARKSDHNPDAAGIVWALDLTTTHQGPGGSAALLAEHLRASRDPRISYVIHRGMIFAGWNGPAPWHWRAYHGPNGHWKHVHISGRGNPHDTSPWHYQEADMTPEQAAQLQQARDHAAAADLRALDNTQRLQRVESQLAKVLAKLEGR